jgi:hypothetical protein
MATILQTRPETASLVSMTAIRTAFLEAADTTAGLLANPAVAAKWGEPSALTGFTVGGLAMHLASQVLNTQRALEHELSPELPHITLLDHYARSVWVEAAVDHEVNVGIVAGAEAEAVEGPAGLATKVDATVAELRHRLPAEPADRWAAMPWWKWCTDLDDLLVTRMMEMAVHSDDLAVSVTVSTPALPDAVLDPVLALLSQLSQRRHGSLALLRAYSRRERAPESISAF